MLKTLGTIVNNSVAWDLGVTGLLKWLLRLDDCTCLFLQGQGFLSAPPVPQTGTGPYPHSSFPVAGETVSPDPKLTTLFHLISRLRIPDINHHSFIQLCDVVKNAGNFNLSAFTYLTRYVNSLTPYIFFDLNDHLETLNIKGPFLLMSCDHDTIKLLM
jgi:hypothetical protein